MLAQFKALPVQGEYLHWEAFDTTTLTRFPVRSGTPQAGEAFPFQAGQQTNHGP